MVRWFKSLFCKHTLGTYIKEGTCYNACKHCKKANGGEKTT